MYSSYSFQLYLDLVIATIHNIVCYGEIVSNPGQEDQTRPDYYEVNWSESKAEYKCPQNPVGPLNRMFYTFQRRLERKDTSKSEQEGRLCQIGISGDR